MNQHELPVIVAALKDGVDELMLVPPAQTDNPTECIHWGDTGLEHVTSSGIETITENDLCDRANNWAWYRV